jgi:probable F420-dependent oxidoreductase
MRSSERQLKFGISLLRVNPALWTTVALEAERLGFESVWMSDHLVMPAEPDDHRNRNLINPATPIFDVMVYLATLAAVTTTLRLGTYVYQLGLRHPFVAARAVTTLDVVSDGRVELGVGAGYISQEWTATGLDFARRGSLLDEALAICRTLWTEPVTQHEGQHYRFPAVTFEPKPVQKPHPPIHIGGESGAALRRAVQHGDGWIGMHHTPGTAAAPLERVRLLAQRAARTKPLEITVAAHPGLDAAVDEWRDARIDRLIVAPWTRTSQALEGMRAFSERHIPL